MSSLRRDKTADGGPAREPLSHILGTRAKVSCLRVLCLVKKPLTQREVARRAGVQHRSSQLALDDLVQLGVVTRIEGGRDLLVSISRDHHLSDVLRALFGAESEQFLSLRRDLAEAVSQKGSGTSPESVSLFGSVARGNDKAGSDMDVLVLVARKTDTGKVLSRIDGARAMIAARYGFEVRPIVYTVAEARKRWAQGVAPFPQIKHDHMVLAGPPLGDLLGDEN